MNIVFSIKALNNSGGTERVTAILTHELAERGNNVHIVSFVGGGEKPFFEIDSRVKCHYLAGVKDRHLFPVRDIRRIIKMRRLYKEINPDVVIIVDAGRSFVNIPAAKGYKTITWEHFNVEHNWHWGHSLSRRIAAKHSDVIVALTHHDASVYAGRLGAKRSICIYNPVTIDNSAPSELSQKICMTAGRLTKDKNFIDLVRAWGMTKARQKGWKLRIIGRGELEGMLKEEVERLGISASVEFLPPQKDMPSQYRDASLCAMSSLHEGLPLVLIEAMSMGLPIVCYDSPHGPREVVSDGETGILVKYLDVSALAESLDKVMLNDELRHQMSARALKEVDKFSVKRIVDIWVKLLDEL